MRDLVEVQRTELVEPGQAPKVDEGGEIGIERMAVPPYYANPGLDGLGVGAPGTGYDSSVILSYDRIPHGSVELGRHSAIVSAGGDHLGHLTGILVGHDNEVLQLVLEHGHLWSKHEAAVPLSAVARMVTDEVTLTLSAAEARKLGRPN